MILFFQQQQIELLVFEETQMFYKIKITKNITMLC